jgi:DNA end-binding protein Ku
MARAIWSGAISFGLVNVPVRMYSAIDEKDVHFHFLHEKDGSRIGYEKICRKEGKPVPDDEIVRGYEYAKGKYVYLTEEDFAAAAVEGYKTIDITDFVSREEIDPVYFEKTYYLGPQEGGEKVYTLLRRAMEEAGLAGIATYIMREKQHLGALRVIDGVIALEKMFFADEIRPTDEIAPASARVDKRELDMALQLIDRFAGKFKPEKYEDTYREQLLAIIDAKRKGKEVHVEPAPKAEEPADLMDALRASLETAKSRRSASRSRSASSSRKRGTTKGRTRKTAKKAA